MSSSDIDIILKARDEATSTINGVSSSLSGLGSSSSSITSGLENVSTSSLKMAGAFALAQIGIESVSAALESAKNAFIGYNATQEQVAIGFTTLLHSAEAADTFMAQLSKFAADTPFDLPGVQDSAKKMLAFGWAAKDIIPDLTAVGDAAAGLGVGAEGVKRITLALGQMKAKGVVQGDELLQLAEAGIPAYDILAEKLGLTAKQVHNIGNEGIESDKAIQALVEGMEERFSGMMDAQSNTFLGMLSTVKDNSATIFGAIGSGLFDALKAPMASLRDMTNNIVTDLREGGISQALQNLIPAGAFATIDKVFTALAPVISGLKDSVGDLLTSFMNLIGAIGQSAIFDALITGLTNAAVVAMTVESVFKEIASVAVNILAGAFTMLDSAISPVIDTMKNIGVTILDSIAGAFDTIYNTVSGIWNNLCNYLADAIDGAVKTIGATFDKISNTAVFQGIVTVLEGIGVAVVAVVAVFVAAGIAIGTVVGAIVDAISGLYDSISEYVSEIADTVSADFDDLETSVSAIWDSICDYVGSVIDDLVETASELWDELCEYISSAMDSVSQTLSDIWTGICNIFLGAWNWINDMTGGALQDAYNMICGAFAAVGDSLNSIWNAIANSILGKVVEFVNGIIAELGPLGSLIDSVGSKISSAVSSIRSITLGGGGGFGQYLKDLAQNIKRETAKGLEDLRNNKGHSGPSAGDDAKGSKGRSSGGSGADKEAKEAEKAADKIENIWAKLQEKIVDETGTDFEKGMAKLNTELVKMQQDIDKAASHGIDITDVTAKMTEYAKVIKDKLTKAWKEAWQDLKNQTALGVAQLTGDKSGEAAAQEAISLASLQKDKEKRLKAVQQTGDDAQAKAAVEVWYTNQAALLEQKRADDTRKANIDIYNNQIEVNGYLVTEHTKTQQEVDRLNRSILSNKISYLQKELQNEKLTADEKLAIHKELADAKKAVTDTPKTNREGWMAGLRSYTESLKTEAQQWKDAAVTAAGAMTDSFQSLFVDAMQGKLKSLGDYITSFLQGVQKAIAQVFAQQATSSLLKFILPGVGSGGSQWSFSGFNIPGFHAAGGRAQTGDTFVAGENGPELIKLDGSGAQITSTHTTQSKLGSGGVNMQVNVINQSGTPVDAKQGNMQFDGEKYILTVFLNAVQNNTMGVRNTLAAARG